MTPRALGIVLSPPEWAWLEEHRGDRTTTQFAHEIIQRFITVNELTTDTRTIRKQIEEGPL